jgi:hypothetical protein
MCIYWVLRFRDHSKRKIYELLPRNKALVLYMFSLKQLSQLESDRNICEDKMRASNYTITESTSKVMY